MTKKSRILVVEDEPDIREGLEALLEGEFDIQLVENGVAAIKAMMRACPDLILLDLNLPELDGFQTCKALRAEPEFDAVPVIVLTAYNDAEERIRAFEAGADDYVSKPFNNTELLTRIRRKLATRSVRMVGSSSDAGPETMLRCGELEIDIIAGEVKVRGAVLAISALEFKLLWLFVKHQNSLLSRKRILEVVWEDANISERLIDPHVLALRQKIARSGCVISTVYGRGYVLKSCLDLGPKGSGLHPDA